MSDTRLKGLAGLTAAGLFLVIVFGSILGSASIAADLQPRAERALAAAGLDGVLVQVDGREVALTGGSRVDLREAESIVRDIRGVRRVDAVGGATGGARPDVVPDVGDVPRLALVRRNGGVRIDGAVSTADAAADIKAGASLAFGATVTGDLVVNPSVGSAGWVDDLPDLLADLAEVEDLELAIDGGGSVIIAGVVADRSARTEVTASVQAAFSDLEVVNDIEIARGG